MRFNFPMAVIILTGFVIQTGCNPKPPKPAALVKVPQSGLGAWQVNNAAAQGMITSAQHVPCNAFTVVDSNFAIKRLIDSAYNNSNFTISFVKIRYVTQADEDRYRSLRNLAPGNPKGKIKGLCNTMYSIKSAAGAEGEELYYDIFSVCPPPPDCDRDSTASTQSDTTSTGG